MNDVTSLIFGAPKFREFAVDIGNELIDREICSSLVSLCTGGPQVVNCLREGLGTRLSRVDDVEAYERAWLEEEVASEWLRTLEAELGVGAIGDTITSDRRIGRGFVTGGITRPDPIGRRAYADPITIPERYISRLYQYLDSILNEIRPRFVFAYAVAGAPAYLMGRMCYARGIPFLRLTPARLGNRYLVDDDMRSLMAPVTRELVRNGRDKAAAEISPEVRELLDTFRNAPETPEYSKRNRRILSQSGVSQAVWRAARKTASIGWRRTLGRPVEGASIGRAWFDVELALRRRFMPTKTFAPSLPGGDRWYYFPLHVDPEASTMVAAPGHTNQLAVVEAIAKALPAGARLVVKEHLPMLGRRPRGFYSSIARMPRVVLVGPEREGIWWLLKSHVIVTITGTAGWEAIRLGKPVVFIGDSPFSEVGSGVIQKANLNELPRALEQALHEPPVQASRVNAFTDALFRVSFELPTSLLWGRYSDHDGSVRKRAVTDISKGIEARLTEIGA